MSMEKEKKASDPDSFFPDLPDTELDQYGVWVKAGPETVEDDAPDLDELELSDLSDRDSGISPEEEALLDPLEKTSGAAPMEPGPGDLDDFSFPDEEIDEELLSGFTDAGASGGAGRDDSLDLDFDLEAPDLDSLPPEHPPEDASIAFDDLEAVERDMSDAAPPPAPKSAAVSGDILSRIEKELATIKSELAELKRELSVLKPSMGAAGPSAAEEPAEEAGFFEEDEDETIALTGDELDNILSTADITEETGESDIPPEGLEIDLKPDEDIIPLEEPAAPLPEFDTGSEGLSVTSPEEMAIIEEYNRELDNFGVDEFRIGDEDAIDAREESGLIEDGASLDEIPVEVPLAEEAEGLDFDLADLEEPEDPNAHAGAESDVLPPMDEWLEMPEELEVELAEPEVETLPPLEEAFQMPRELEAEPAEEVEEIPAVEPPEAAGPADNFFLMPEGGLEMDIPEESEEASPKTPQSRGAAPQAPASFEEDLPELDDLMSEGLEEVPAEADEITAGLDLEPLEEEVEVSPQPPLMEEPPLEAAGSSLAAGIPENLKEEVKTVLKYMDQPLEDLPEEKIREFARSEHFEVYRRLFEELGLE